jgi:glycosyltransferase involved in cell wall biosynthesis
MTPWILIPVYQPTQALVDFVDALIALEIDRIVIVNDGSRSECSKIFAKVVRHPEVVLMQHAVNLGKGAALKTGFNYFLLNAAKEVPGIVTVDGDGQHLPEDVARICSKSIEKPLSLIVGAREFNLSHKIPLRSRIGNIITKNCFRFLLGKKLSDTQTGLRYIPTFFIPKIIKINSNGYEFEFEMLVRAVVSKICIAEFPIKTVYINNNESLY